FDLQYPGHHRMTREMSLEERFVEADVLQRRNPRTGFKLKHPIDQQHRVAMRHQFQDVLDVEVHFLSPPRSLLASSSRTRRRNSSSWRMIAAAFSHSRCFMIGKNPV